MKNSNITSKMENNKFVLVPLHLWKEGCSISRVDSYSPSSDMISESNNEKMNFFNRAQKIPKPSQSSGKEEKNVRTISSLSTKLKETLLEEFKRDSKAKKIVEELFDNNSIDFSINNTIIVRNTDTEVNVREFVYDMRHKSANFNPRYSIILQELKLPSRYVSNSTALSDNDDSWITFSF